MSLLLTRLSRLRLVKPATVMRSSLMSLSNGFSTSLLQNTPCSILGVALSGVDLGKLIVQYANEVDYTTLEKKVPLKLVYNDPDDEIVTIGASHGWIATLNREEGIMHLQDDLNPVASTTNPKRIPLPPLVTMPHCQTEIVTNVSMSSAFPEDEGCVVVVKFFGPQLSFCRPAQRNVEWVNIRIENPCFFSSPVMYSKKDDMFRIPGSGGHLIGSWDIREHNRKPKLQRLQYLNHPELSKIKWEQLHSCCMSEHLVESQSTGETFLVKVYKKTAEIIDGVAKMKTKHVLVFRLDEEGNAVYTQDIGDLSIFLSKAEPFAVPATSFPGSIGPVGCNCVIIWDVDEITYFDVSGFHTIISNIGNLPAPFHIPPQNLN